MLPIDLSDERSLLDGMLNSVYLFEDCIVATLNFKGARNDLAEVRIALDEADDEPKFVLDSDGWGTRIRT